MPSPPSASTPPTRSAVTDSPWFWLSVFGGMGALALVAIAPKYAQRQARIERRFEVRERLGYPSSRIGTRGAVAPPEAVEFAKTERAAEESGLLVPLWPLIVVALLMCGWGAWRVSRAGSPQQAVENTS